MSASTDSASADLPIADLRNKLEAQIHELLSGRADVSIDTDEAAGRIQITIDVAPSAFEEADETEGEVAANAAPDYSDWLRSNSDDRAYPSTVDVPAGAGYWEWKEAHEAREK